MEDDLEEREVDNIEEREEKEGWHSLTLSFRSPDDFNVFLSGCMAFVLVAIVFGGLMWSGYGFAWGAITFLLVSLGGTWLSYKITTTHWD